MTGSACPPMVTVNEDGGHGASALAHPTNRGDVASSFETPRKSAAPQDEVWQTGCNIKPSW
jgi:hypothetical protein